MSKCPACSAPVSAGSRYCSVCGASIAAGDDATAFDDRTTPIGTRDREARATPGAAASTSSSFLGRNASSADARFIPGAMVADRYRIVGLLGRGGMGEVYRADDLKLGQPVALKFLPEGLDRDPDRLERFLNEVRTARQVTHPNVCRVYDIGDVDGQHFLSMEYVDGEDLASLLLRIGRLPQERAVTVARQICAGLSAAHEQGILHRDLKPANVMIDGRGRVRLTDFGLAGLAATISRDEARAGTPAYMAPEQIAGRGVSTRSDIYALGLVLYELFTGRRVFQADSAADLRRQQESSTPSRPSTWVEELDPAVERAVLHCLERNPEDRPSSVLAVSAALPGGDPLAAALAAGETPSPELLAEAGRSDAMRPAIAILWAVIGFVIFVAASRWAGTKCDLNYLPLEKRPEVLIDRAQEILAQLGFVEPAYSDPVDQSWGLMTWKNVFDEVAAADSSSSRWEGLRKRPDAGSFWYRQSPRPLLPEPEGQPIFVRGPVTLMNPLSVGAGEVTVIFDLAGRLRRLEVLPKRFATEDPAAVDWAPLFALAELDTSRFTEVQPRYQRFFAPDLRRAWVGSRPDDPDVELRVEAGAHQGRPVLFNVATRGSMDEVSSDPEPARLDVGALVAESATPVIILVVALLSIGLVRRNLVRGRADGRGAARVATALFVLFVVASALKSHALFSALWAREIWPLFAGGSFLALIAWLMYSAAEPMGRRVWPTMFVSSSRLLSRPQVHWRDALIGRSVIVAVVAGATLFAWNAVVGRLVEIAFADAPPNLSPYDLSALLGQRQALGAVLEVALTFVMSVLQIVALVVIRWLVQKKWIAMVLTLAVWTVFSGIESTHAAFLHATAAAGSMFVLLRWGAVAFALTNVVVYLGWLARSTDLSAWYGTGAVFALLAVAALAAYGVWAATGGRPSAGIERYPAGSS